MKFDPSRVKKFTFRDLFGRRRFPSCLIWFRNGWNPLFLTRQPPMWAEFWWPQLANSILLARTIILRVRKKNVKKPDSKFYRKKVTGVMARVFRMFFLFVLRRSKVPGNILCGGKSNPPEKWPTLRGNKQNPEVHHKAHSHTHVFSSVVLGRKKK